jgi:hypothetical protein
VLKTQLPYFLPSFLCSFHPSIIHIVLPLSFILLSVLAFCLPFSRSHSTASLSYTSCCSPVISVVHLFIDSLKLQNPAKLLTRSHTQPFRPSRQRPFRPIRTTKRVVRSHFSLVSRHPTTFTSVSCDRRLISSPISFGTPLVCAVFAF